MNALQLGVEGSMALFLKTVRYLLFWQTTRQNLSIKIEIKSNSKYIVPETWVLWFSAAQTEHCKIQKQQPGIHWELQLPPKGCSSWQQGSDLLLQLPLTRDCPCRKKGPTSAAGPFPFKIFCKPSVTWVSLREVKTFNNPPLREKLFAGMHWTWARGVCNSIPLFLCLVGFGCKEPIFHCWY